MQATQAFAPPRSTAAALRELFGRLAELDFAAPPAFAALAVLYIASRIAWLDHGYGTDPDAWRVALSARYLWLEGEYLPSRLPGYPLHELATAALLGRRFLVEPWVWTNLSTVLISLAGVYLFARLARELEVPNRGVLTLGFAFAPLLWINSAMTMDYMWALSFVLGAYLAIIHKSSRLAGFALGIAAGFRLTSLFMLLPFWLLLVRTGRRGELRPVTTTALAVTLVAYILVLMDYGINFLNFYDESVPLAEFVKRLGKDGLGIVAGLGLIAALLLSLGSLRRLPGDLVRDPHVLVWTTVIVVYFLSYTRLPHEIAYLIPLFPFGYFLLARYLSRTVLAAALALIVLGGFVDITTPDDEIGLSADTFTSARIGEGMLFSSIDTMRNQMSFARELREVTTTHPSITTPAIVSTGFIYPELVVLYEDELEIGVIDDDVTAISQLSDKGLARDEVNDIYYVWLLELEELQFFENDHRSPYMTADAERSTYSVYRYRPGYFGSLLLPLSRDNPSLGEGTASTNR